MKRTPAQSRAFCSDLEDARLLWEMLKMEIRAATIAYSKNNRIELEITWQLEILDRNICDNFNSPDIARILKEYEDLKTELNLFTRRKGGRLFLDRNVVGSKKANVQQSTFSILRKETTTGRSSLNCE